MTIRLIKELGGRPHLGKYCKGFDMEDLQKGHGEYFETWRASKCMQVSAGRDTTSIYAVARSAESTWACALPRSNKPALTSQIATIELYDLGEAMARVNETSDQWTQSGADASVDIGAQLMQAAPRKPA
jgi:hypothetical protein